MTDSIAEKSKYASVASRKQKSTPLGTSLFLGLRTVDVALQYSILKSGWGIHLIQALGGKPTALIGTSYLGLTPYHAILTAMALGSTLKQNIWIAIISEQEMQPSSALIIVAFNTVFNSLNSLLSLWALTSVAPQIPSPSASILDVCKASLILFVDVSLYAVSIFTEVSFEMQRKIFKRNFANKGKSYEGGLFSLATNVNYDGYTLWRAGFSIAAAGLPWGAVVGSFFFYDFVTRGIPSLDEYCTEKVWLALSNSIKCYLTC